jgi:hypothetical protein
MSEHSIQARRARRSVLALAAVTALVLSLSFTTTAAPAPSKPHRNAHSKHHKKHKKGKARSARAPLTGIYDACVVSSPKTDKPLPDCADRLAVLRQGGFRVVLNYATAGMSLEDDLIYAAHAQAAGMKVIWNLGTYRNLNTGERIPLEPKLDLVRATMDLPATWGYYIGDEHPEFLSEVSEVSSAVRAITNRPLLYVSRPNPSKLRPFKGLADYLGPDSYPVGPFDKPVCQTARWASKMVKTNLTMVLQAYSWSIDYPSLNPQWPSAGQMRRMREQATRCGDPKLLLWFCFHCVTDYNPDPDPYWRQVAWAANGVSLGPTYRMSSVGT